MIISALKDRAIEPHLLANSMLHIIFPFAFVAGPIGMDQPAHAIGSAIFELSGIHVTIGMNHTAETGCLVVDKVGV